MSRKPQRRDFPSEVFSRQSGPVCRPTPAHTGQANAWSAVFVYTLTLGMNDWSWGVGRTQGRIGSVSLFLLNLALLDFPFSACAFPLPLPSALVAAASNLLTNLTGMRELRAMVTKCELLMTYNFVWLDFLCVKASPEGSFSLVRLPLFLAGNFLGSLRSALSLLQRLEGGGLETSASPP